MQTKYLIGILIVIFLCGIGSAERCNENGVICPGQPLVYSDRIEFDNSTVFDLKAGEEQDIMFRFYHYPYYGYQNISYVVSETPLNVTVPAEFLPTPEDYIYPAKITVRADSHLPPGNYSFFIDVSGTQGFAPCNQSFSVNVTPAEKQSPLPITLPFLAVIAMGLLFSYHRKKWY